MSTKEHDKTKIENSVLDRRKILLGSTTLAAASAIGAGAPMKVAQAQAQQPAAPSGRRPNILVIWGDDIGQSNVSAYTFGLMGYKTPNIDRIAREGMMFTDYYAEQSCTAGRASFITGQSGLRTGLTKVGIPVVFYFLGTLVSVIQAFVFMLLSMIYIALSVSHHD